MPKNLLKIPDLQTLWSYPEGTRILLIGPKSSDLWVRSVSNEGSPCIVNADDYYDQAVTCWILEDQLQFVNYRLVPWWGPTGVENDLEVYAILEEKGVFIQRILKAYAETGCVTDEDLEIVIAFLEDLNKKLWSLGGDEYTLFRSALYQKFEQFRGFKDSRERK